jgi:hypothetical protein
LCLLKRLHNVHISFLLFETISLSTCPGVLTIANCIHLGPNQRCKMYNFPLTQCYIIFMSIQKKFKLLKTRSNDLFTSLLLYSNSIIFVDVLFNKEHCKIASRGCWILSWAATLEISPRRRSDKPVKNL